MNANTLFNCIRTSSLVSLMMCLFILSACEDDISSSVSPESVTLTCKNLIATPGMYQAAAGTRLTFELEPKWQVPNAPQTRWDFGDGSEQEWFDGFTGSHIYKEPGEYKVVVNLIEAGTGEIYAYSKMSFEVVDASPLITCQYDTVMVEPGEGWFYKATCSDFLGVFDTLYYNWRIDGGSWSGFRRGGPSGDTYHNEFETPGEYNYIVTCKTWRDTIASDTCRVIVTPYKRPAMTTQFTVELYRMDLQYIDSTKSETGFTLGEYESTNILESFYNFDDNHVAHLFPWFGTQSFEHSTIYSLSDVTEHATARIQLSPDGKMLERLVLDYNESRPGTSRYENFHLELAGIPLVDVEGAQSNRSAYHLEGAAVADAITKLRIRDFRTDSSGDVVWSRTLESWKLNNNAYISIRFER